MYIYINSIILRHIHTYIYICICLKHIHIETYFIKNYKPGFGVELFY